MRQLSRDILLASEDTLKVRPLTLHSKQQFKGFSDLRNVILPEVDLVIELRVVR
jgi:hypothetical protein